MCLYGRACVCVQRACKSLVICYLCFLHKCHLRGMCAHAHAQTHTLAAVVSSMSRWVKLQHQNPTQELHLLLLPPLCPFRLLFSTPNTSRRLSVYSERHISTHSIKFQSNLSHWTLASDWGKANRDRANKAAAVRPCLAAWYNVSCDESWELSLLSPPKY